MNNFNENQLKAIKSKDSSIVILAPAGSGKTTTLVGAITEYKDEYPDAKVAAITFTRKAADELASRLIEYHNIRTSTIHSWAYNELDKLAQRVRKEHPESAFKVKLLEEDKIKEILKEIIYKRGYRYLNMYQLYSYIMGNYNIDVPHSIKRVFESVRVQYIQYKKDYGLYDFTDLPQYLLDKMNDYDTDINDIDALFIDEFQDVDDVQLELFERVHAVKKFYIGDPQQCQPSGTKIRMSDGSQKNIEDIKIGDRVVSYYPSDSYISGCIRKTNGFEVLETKERDFVNDYLITVASENGKISRYTPNHKTFAAIRSDNKYNHLVYLMEDKYGRFRIGTSQFYKNYNGQDMSTFRHKLVSEGYKNAWILKVAKTDEEVRLYENKYSYQFQIPQITFQLSKSNYTNKELDFIYKDINSYDGAKKCLEHLKLDIKYPLLSKNDSMDFRRDAFRKFYAINLIPEVMSILTHDSNKPANRNKNRIPSKLVSVQKDFITKSIKVYSLKIDKYETYIADDIVTHNSIYIFRGATPDVLKKLSGFKTHNLDINYRSFQEIIDFARTIQDMAMNEDVNFTFQKESWPAEIACIKGYGGEVYSLNASGNAYRINEYVRQSGKQKVKDFIMERTMILCRKNKEVRKIKKLGYENVSTIHQAKGLEYPSVIVTSFNIGPEEPEEVNIAYVGMTRAENKLMVADFDTLFHFMSDIMPEYNLKTKLF